MSKRNEQPENRTAQPAPAPRSGSEKATIIFPATTSQNLGLLPVSETQYVLNNHWGRSAQTTGSQSATVISPTAWSTTFNWSRPDDWQVTSYVALEGPGRHMGYYDQPSYPVPSLGIPIQGPERIQVQARYQMDPPASPTCRYNVAFDNWYSASANPTGGPLFELMIWPAYSQDYLANNVPDGSGPTINGIRWKLYMSKTRNPTTVDTLSFIIDQPDQSLLWDFDWDLKPFTDWLMAHQGGLVPGQPVLLDPSWYLNSIEFGTEAYKGSGTLTVDHYAVQIEGGGNGDDGDLQARVDALETHVDAIQARLDAHLQP